MQGHEQSVWSAESKTTSSSSASELPDWYESQVSAVVGFSDWEYGSGTSAWSDVTEAQLWDAILAKLSHDLELYGEASELSDGLDLYAGGPVDGDDWEAARETSAWNAPEVLIALVAESSWSTSENKNKFDANVAGLNKPSYNAESAKFEAADPRSTVAGSLRSKSDFSGFGKNAFGSDNDFWNEASEAKLSQSEDADSESTASAPLIAALIVPGSKAFQILQELGTDEFKLFESVSTSGQKKPAHAIEQEPW